MAHVPDVVPARWLTSAPELTATWQIAAFALWIRPLRPWAFALGLIRHGLVPATMGLYAGLVVFSLLVLSIDVLFLDEGGRLIRV